MDLNFLEELYKERDNSNGYISMYELGERLGFDKNQSDAAGMQLITDGFAELVNLSGGIKISEKGITQCMKSGIATEKVSTASHIGIDPILSEDVKRTVSKFAEELKFVKSHREDFKADVSTLLIQLDSPSPKTSIVKAVFEELVKVLENNALKSDIVKFIS